MALTYSELNAITQKKYIPKLYDNIFDSGPLINRAKQKFYEKISGGERIVVPLGYAQITASGWYTGSETLSTADNEVLSAAEYTWKQLYSNITITGADERKNSGPEAILKLVEQKVKIAEKTMSDKLAIGLYSNATDAKSIVGLRQIVGTSNTVGSISQTTYTWWAGQLDSSTTTLTIAAMQSRDNLCTVGSDSPSVIATTRSLYNSYYALLQPQQRFQDAESAKGGFSSLMFNGKPVLADANCPASHMFFLNEDYLHLFVHKDCDMKFEPFQKPVNQDVKVAKVLWFGAFGSSNNRLHGLMNGLTA